jgi:hypothetical protein
LLAHRPTLISFLSAVLLTGLILVSPFQADVEAAKRKSVPVTPPELRIVTVSALPDPYKPGAGVVDFNIEVELPKEVGQGTLLEVSSLVSSPSMSSMRFLAIRQPLSPESSEEATTMSHPGAVKPRVSVTLTWDGMDQSKQLAESGRYHYEIRAKLLAVGENGPRTQMNSWPKRGTLTVK